MSITIPYPLTDRIEFPDPHLALDEPNGLLAFGGDLTVDRLMLAYQMGIFPWFNENDPILWWSPNPRAVIFVEGFKASKSLRKSINKPTISFEIDGNFEQVIEACQSRNPTRESTETWITDEMKAAYTSLFSLGYAHCVACFEEGRFIGGLYGLSFGKIFFGESMISLSANASKMALAFLVDKLKSWGFELIDCQVASEHLFRLGARLISRSQFLEKLQENQKYPLLNPCWNRAM